MSDPFIARGETLRQRLLNRELNADDHELFPLGYLIPQVELVLDRAEYDPATITAEAFDATCWQLIECSIGEDAMSVDDINAITALWTSICADNAV
ncbi:hypothetical protein [Zymobacter sp. IVIA_12111.31 C1]|uniref:hypothetical protein n=1 Tax=Zymobacter sp. IVIA_12111.31 C1 TaxID=3394854 RepID=UPI0039C4E334